MRGGGHAPLDGAQAAPGLVEAGQALEQPQRVRVPRILKQFGDRRLLDELARVHDGHLVGGLGDDAEVVRDEQDGHVPLGLELAEQVQDLRLNGHVEGGGRLVGDEQFGIAREGHGDHGPLPHAAGHLVGILAGPLRRVGYPDLAEEIDGLIHRAVLRYVAMDPDRRGNLASDTKHRIQRRHRLLKDH